VAEATLVRGIFPVKNGPPNATLDKSRKNSVRFTPLLVAALLFCSPDFATAGQNPEVAITFDDLPAHGDLAGWSFPFGYCQKYHSRAQSE